MHGKVFTSGIGILSLVQHLDLTVAYLLFDHFEDLLAHAASEGVSCLTLINLSLLEQRRLMHTGIVGLITRLERRSALRWLESCARYRWGPNAQFRNPNVYYSRPQGRNGRIEPCNVHILLKILLML